MFLLTVAVVAAGAGYHYVVTRVDEKIRVYFETRLREHYQGLSVSVHSAELIEGEGIEIRGISIVQPTGEVIHAELAHIDEIVVDCKTDWQTLLSGNVDAQQITVRRLKLNAVKGADGRWSIERLFPLPKFGGHPPPTKIQQAAITLVDPIRGAENALVLREVNLALIPEVLPGQALSNAPPRQQITGEVRSDQFEKVTLEGVYDPVLGQWEVRGQVAGLKISSRLVQSLPVEVPGQLEALEGLRATTDLQFRVGSTLKSADAVQFAVTGAIREGRFEDRRLPYAVTSIRGDFQCDRAGWKLENLSATSGGTCLAGSVSGNRFDATSDFTLHANAEQLMLDRRLVSMLPDEVERVWHQFTPLGSLNVDLHLARRNGLYFPSATIDCLDVSFAHEKLPYRLEHATGTVNWNNKDIALKLQAWAGRQAVDLDGAFTLHGTQATGKLSFASNGPVPIDQKMLSALQVKPEAYRIITSFQPRGAVKISGEIEKRNVEDTEFAMHLIVGLHDCSMRYEKFPYPIDHIYGLAELVDGNWTFRGLEGRNDSGYILCEGSYQRSPGENSGLQLGFRCSNVPLEEELRLALPPRMQRAWTDIRPIGTLDQLNVALHYGSAAPGSEKKLTVNATVVKHPEKPGVPLSGLSIEPVWFPYRLDGLAGTGRYSDGKITLEQLRARHGRTNLSCDGVGEFTDAGWSFAISRFAADRLHADADLLAAMPEALGTAASQLQIQGPLTLQGSFTASAAHDHDESRQMTWDVTLDLEDGSVRVGMPLKHIHGGIRLIGGSSGNQFVCGGELEVDSLMYQNLQLLDLRGPIWFDRERVLTGGWVPRDPAGAPPRRLTANVLGGQILGDAQVILKEHAPFSLQANLVEIDLRQTAVQYAPNVSSITGKGFAGVELHGDSSGPHTLRGRGQVRLRDADIYELPVMLAMLKLISVRRPDATAFTDSDIDFRIHGEHVYFDRINFNGDAISLRGNGEVDFERHLNLKFYTLVGNDQLRTRFLESVLGEASKQILMIQVTGTCDDPHVKREAFPGLNESLQQLFPELAQPREGTPPGEPQPPARSAFGRVFGPTQQR